MFDLTLFGLTLPSWILLPAAFFIWVTALLCAKKIFFGVIRRFAAKTPTPLDNIFIQSSDFPLTLLIFAGAGAIVERMTPLAAPTALTNHFSPIFKAAVIIALGLFADRFLTNAIREYSGKVEILRSSGGIVRGVVRIAAICLGLLVLLDTFGVSITPVLASLGIGSLAVALALQPTLENFFSGIQIVIDKPIQMGHFVKLESGEEGYIHKIGWRSTWIRMLSNNIVVIPNKVLVNSRLINYYYPEKELAVLVEAGVHYSSDLEHVERITIEVARDVLKEVSGGVGGFEPFIRYHTFGDFSIHFTVILRAREFVDQYLIKHEFIKRLHKRYAKEGIIIPCPIRALNYKQETEGRYAEPTVAAKPTAGSKALEHGD
jgi:small-conductance mechanosensitive channel